jgi:multidrug transporter EmrE-like cation transporter
MIGLFDIVREYDFLFSMPRVVAANIHNCSFPQILAASRLALNFTMLLTLILAAIIAMGNAASNPQVDLGYGIYEGIANATVGLNIFKGSVAVGFARIAH